MFMFKQTLWGGLYPALIVAFWVFIASKGWRRREEPDARAGWGSALGFGAAYLLAHFHTTRLAFPPPLVPSDALNWLVHISLAAIILGFVEAFFHKNAQLVSVLRLVAVLGALWLTLGFMSEHYWSATETVVWLGALSLWAMLLIDTLDRTAKHLPGGSLPLSMLLLAGAAAIALIKTGNAKVGLLMGALMAASLGALLTAWLKPQLRLAHGGATVFGLLFAILLSFGYFSSADIPRFSEIFSHPQTIATLLVAGAPLMLWLGRVDLIKRLPPALGVLLRASLVLIPLAAAVYFADRALAEPRGEQPFDGIEYNITDE